jgi:hypothetical protein
MAFLFSIQKGLYLLAYGLEGALLLVFGAENDKQCGIRPQSSRHIHRRLNMKTSLFPAIVWMVFFNALVLSGCGGGTEGATPIAPVITIQPANKAVSEKHTATFRVTVSGTAPLTYQWKRDGTDVGSNSSSYTTSATSVGETGAKFSVEVSNSSGTVRSAEATLSVTALPTTTVKIAYLHHSTGGNIWGGGVPTFFTDYNTEYGTHYQIDTIQYPDTGSGYLWANYPYDYWNLWVKHTNLTVPSQDQSELNLDQLAASYDVIVFKHCFPVSSINADDGNPDITSSYQTIANYRLQYNALKTRMKQFPDKKFILWTGAALNAGTTNSGDAGRAQEFFNWVKTTWDEPGDNIYIWDFFALETAGAAPYMNNAYASAANDPHPNSAFSSTVAPYIAQRIVDVIEGHGDTESITGH